MFDAVLGADVARQLGYRVGQEIIVAHGLGAISPSTEDKPFIVTGILRKTGTPVDRTVHVSLAGIEAIHVDWQQGARMPGAPTSVEAVRNMDLTPKQITAFLVGLKSRTASFRLQRAINDIREEPLSAIIPGWRCSSSGTRGCGRDRAWAVSGFVVLGGLLGMLTAILTSLNERRREMAILRSVGARPWRYFRAADQRGRRLDLFGHGARHRPALRRINSSPAFHRPHLWPRIAIDPPTQDQLAELAGIVIAGFAAGLFPALRAYRLSLADGMTVRT